MAAEFRKRPVTITQELLDWHNERRLIFDVNKDMSVNSNQTMASTNFRNSRWVHEMPLEDLYILMKRLEALAAEASIMLTESKRKETIRLEIQQRDKKLVDDVVNGRVTEERKKEIKRNKFTPKEKAINAMMAVGLSREDAIADLEKQEIKKIMKEKSIDFETAKLELFPPSESVN
jgi:glutamyl/glutaminyl-tRNA synthetase